MAAGTNIVQRDKLMNAESVLSNLVNAGATTYLLLYRESLFPLAAVIASDSSRFVLTRGRGLVFAVLGFMAAAVLVALPAVSVGLQVAEACESTSSLSTSSVPEQPGPDTAEKAHLCQAWAGAILLDPFSGFIMVPLGFFFAVWAGFFLQTFLQFIAAHVTAQNYGNMTNTRNMEEDDFQAVLRAVK